MILVDDREGSKQLYVSLDKAGLPCTLTRLEFGDLCFVGRGEKGVPVDVGIEHKQIADVVQSLRNNRLGDHQLTGMRGTEGERPEPLYNYCWLCIEGIPIYDSQGMLMRRIGRKKFRPLGMTITEMYKRLTVLHLCAGLNWEWFHTRRDSVRWIDAIYHTFTDKDLDKHKSHLGIYEGPSIGPRSQFERTVRTLPGVGASVASAAKRVFVNKVNGQPSITRAITALTRDWAELETTDDKGKKRKFGASKAEKLKESVK